MIKDNTFDLAWIMTFNNKPQRANPVIIEKEIYALKLLELIKETNLDFVFKGGTCLSLILQKFTRLSIDIDITVNLSEEDVMEFISKVKFKPYFTKFEEHPRQSKTGILKKHFKFYYTSKHTHSEDYVLLDIVFEENYYNIIETKVDFLLLQTEEPYYYVKTPRLEDMLVDKLTAFAPNTIGVLYKKEKYMEIIKQMYDVSKMSKKIGYNSVSSELYIKLAERQIVSRELKVDYIECLKDSIYTALNILTKGEYDRKHFLGINNAISGFHGYVYGNRFTYIDAEDAAIDVLHVATVILSGGHDKFDGIIENCVQVKSVEKFKKVFRDLKGNHGLTGQFKRLNNLLNVLCFLGIEI